ncbi:MAG: hypothetical protein KY395_03870 [Actinobacteria bacterium]|nr:hypothetical protein [Actinomycetota bacterium]
MTATRFSSFLLPTALALLLASCGSDTTVSSRNGSADDDAIYTAPSATVLEGREHGPQLCLGGVQESLPPQCGGPDIVGWDWDDVDDEESVSGVTWGEYSVTGTWDGERLTLTEKPGPPVETKGPVHDFSTPCEAPEGGWQPVDPPRTTHAAQDSALSYAQEQPEFAGAWLDQLNPVSERDNPEESANDPSSIVLNLRFTEELARHEAEVRRRWGGALCVTPADHPLSQLRAIQTEVGSDIEGVLYSSVDQVNGVVDLGVVIATQEMQRFLDEKYGEGLVRLSGALQPKT